MTKRKPIVAKKTLEFKTSNVVDQIAEIDRYINSKVSLTQGKMSIWWELLSAWEDGVQLTEGALAHAIGLEINACCAHKIYAMIPTPSKKTRDLVVSVVGETLIQQIDNIDKEEVQHELLYIKTTLMDVTKFKGVEIFDSVWEKLIENDHENIQFVPKPTPKMQLMAIEGYGIDAVKHIQSPCSEAIEYIVSRVQQLFEEHGIKNAFTIKNTKMGGLDEIDVNTALGALMQVITKNCVLTAEQEVIVRKLCPRHFNEYINRQTVIQGMADLEMDAYSFDEVYKIVHGR